MVAALRRGAGSGPVARLVERTVAFLDEATWRGRVYSDGWVSPAGGEATVTEPATGGQLGRTRTADPADVARAVRLAAAAQSAWAALPHTERAPGRRYLASQCRRDQAVEHPGRREGVRGGPVRDARRDRGDLRGGHAAVPAPWRADSQRAARRIPTGIVHINEQTVDDEPNVPFGGVLASGTGARFGGTANHDAFTETCWVTMRADIASYPF